ncbi:hypothetical protein BACCAP_04549 [Pseudoflavonifractor capillosus ATCC 29799]|uniref:Uncharacterized protein n=1 Tax=Pseudoflavonifractor capillosus ATCC 29799 TaxID=411467 RepID=A6P220_9FIRM|nr:hypothetical protein BACCAP_04549 [Pseudoflavonifractor capillosus ATCC 29799]
MPVSGLLLFPGSIPGAVPVVFPPPLCYNAGNTQKKKGVLSCES